MHIEKVKYTSQAKMEQMCIVSVVNIAPSVDDNAATDVLLLSMPDVFWPLFKLWDGFLS